MHWHAGGAHSLDAPGREQEMPAQEVLELLSLQGSETLIDYGAGTGRLALAATGRLAPEGRVVAADNSPEMFQILAERLAGVDGAEPMLIESGHVPLPDGVADRVLAVDVLHHVPPDTLVEMRRLLGTDGLLLLIDWERGHVREGGPPDAVLLTPSQAVRELGAAGLQARIIASPFAHRYVLLASADGSGRERT